MLKTFFMAVALWFWTGADSWGAEVIAGPVKADVVSVYDGDTIRVKASIWPGHTVAVSVRIDGIDTPEIRGKCEAEKTGATAAKARVRQLAGDWVWLRNIRLGKYAGRVLANVGAANGADIGAVLILEGLARKYDGGKREPWCP